VFALEVNYTSMTSGAGPAPMLAYGDVLLAHGASMMAVAGVSAGNAAGTFASWQGAGAVSAAVAGVGLNAQTLALADVAMTKAQIAHAAAAAHSATVARMVTHVQATANRTHEATDEAINPWVLGALTPEIAALNLEYFGFMWPNNAAAGVGYGAALDGFGVALMAPAPPVLSGASPAAAASAAAAIAETAVVDGVGAAMRAAEQGATAVMGPVAAAPSAAGLLGGGPLAAPSSSVSSAQHHRHRPCRCHWIRGHQSHHLRARRWATLRCGPCRLRRGRDHRCRSRCRQRRTN
jgi:PPE-repeat protein